jgi:hypothetical protein
LWCAKAPTKFEVLSLFFILGNEAHSGPVLGGMQPLRGCAFAGVSAVLGWGFSGALSGQRRQLGAGPGPWRGGRLHGVFKPVYGGSVLGGERRRHLPVLQPADAAGGFVLESGLVDSGRGVLANPQMESTRIGSLGAFPGMIVEFDGVSARCEACVSGRAPFVWDTISASNRSKQR